MANCVKDGNAKVPAFRRRRREKDNGEPRDVWDEDGLSLGLSPAEACQDLGENFGVIKPSVERLLARHFELDEPSGGYVHVTNMPFYTKQIPGEMDRAKSKELLMLECVVEVLPPFVAQ